MTYLEFCAAVGFLCRTYRCSVTSWWRSPERNTHVGGHPQSRHLEGLAADLVPEGVPRATVVDAAHRLGLGALDEDDHVHVQVRRTGVGGD